MRSPQLPESFGDDSEHHTNIQAMASVNPSAYDPIDDIFGSDPESLVHGLDNTGTNGHADISLDTRRLQAQHNTVGYRQGITAGKAVTIQAGFDDGFALGANIGIRAGQILGLLEGVSAALAEAGPSDESVRAGELLSQATAELNPESLFTSKFWAPDGAWTYTVTASRDGETIGYQDVADQHPLISKWSRIADSEAQKWDLDQSPPIFAGNELPTQDDTAAQDVSSKPHVAARVAIEW
ncbi:hypothetical protein F4861DRAFT_305167 [Xylaria intraflava]|nr:hypothetical protein F4861DRAFT_305167 [Xylaria intraflava]